MWKSIKKFFKWIADHTGISWISRKISSGWNSIKNWWSGNQEDDFVLLDIPKKQCEQVEEKHVAQSQKPESEPVIGSVCENNGVLELFVTMNYIDKVFGNGVGLSGNADLNYTEAMDKLKYHVYVKCEKGEVFQITCGKLIDVNEKGAFLNVKSVASQDGKTSSDKLATMKQMLDLSEKQAVVAVTQISKNPITVPKVVANGNTPNSETTNPEAEQHTVGDDLSVNA